MRGAAKPPEPGACRGAGPPRWAAPALLLAVVLILPAGAPLRAHDTADDEAPAGDEEAPPAADETVIPIEVGTTADLSATSVGYIWDVAVAETTYVAIEDQGLWILQPDGKTIEKVPAPTEVIGAVATDGTTYFLATSSGLYAGRNGEWALVVADIMFTLCIQTDPPLYLAAAWKGMWRSEDGMQWTRAPLPELQTLRCAIRGSTAYAATTSGMYRSTDSGQTWVLKSARLDPYVEGVAIDGNTVYAATGGGGLYVSTDGAESWQRVTSPAQVLQDVSVADGVIAVISEGTVFRSGDGGNTWVSDGSRGALYLKADTLLNDVEARQ